MVALNPEPNPNPGPDPESPGDPDPSHKAPLSDGKRAANRENAKRSTGPRTPEGKERSRLNATRHGFRAALPVEDCPQFQYVRDDDPNAFDDLRDALAADLRTRGAAEQLIVERLARAAWRLRRTEAAEVALLDDAEWGRIENVIYRDVAAREQPHLCLKPHGRELDVTPLHAATAKQFTERGRSGLLTLMQYQVRLEGQMRSCLRDLRQLRQDQVAWAEQEAAEPLAGELAEASPAPKKRRRKRPAVIDLRQILAEPPPDVGAEVERIEEAWRNDPLAARWRREPTPAPVTPSTASSATVAKDTELPAAAKLVSEPVPATAAAATTPAPSPSSPPPPQATPASGVPATNEPTVATGRAGTNGPTVAREAAAPSATNEPTAASGRAATNEATVASGHAATNEPTAVTEEAKPQTTTSAPVKAKPGDSGSGAKAPRTNPPPPPTGRDGFYLPARRPGEKPVFREFTSADSPWFRERMRKMMENRDK